MVDIIYKFYYPGEEKCMLSLLGFFYHLHISHVIVTILDSCHFFSNYHIPLWRLYFTIDT